MKKHYLNILIAALFLLAAILRIVRWSHMDTLHGDEGVQLITAEHFIKYGELPQAGEISALDKDNKFILHNSPLGLYFLALIYILGLGTPEGYVFVFVLINLLQAILLYKAANILFNKKVALVTLILALFANPMIYVSTWTSQPTNAIFVESVAIFVFAYYYRTKKSFYFISASLLSLLATQMYPPMYLLIPLKLVLFFIIWKKMQKRIYYLVIFLLGAYLTYLPLVFVDLTNDFVNFNTFSNFIKTPTSDFSSSTFLSRLIMNFKQILSYVSYDLITTNTRFWISLIILATLIFLLLGKKSYFRKVLFLFSLSFMPALFLSILVKDHYDIGNRTYLFVTIPFLYLFFTAVFSILPKKLFFVLMIIILFYYVRSGFNHTGANFYPSVNDKRASINEIISDSRNRNITLSLVDLWAVSDNDPFGWETSFYWYLLENKAKERLTKIDFGSSKPLRISIDEMKLVYVICHDITENFTISKCTDIFFNDVNPIYFQRTFKVLKILDHKKTPVLVLENV